jgi:hypothetical protein
MSPLLTASQRAKLLANGQVADRDPDFDPCPVVKLFTPDANCTWLLAWLDTEEPDIAFGLCDLGLGFPEIGAVSLTAIVGVRGKLGLPVERDRHWQADRKLSEYATKARADGHIR